MDTQPELMVKLLEVQGLDPRKARAIVASSGADFEKIHAARLKIAQLMLILKLLLQRWRQLLGRRVRMRNQSKMKTKITRFK